LSSAENEDSPTQQAAELKPTNAFTHCRTIASEWLLRHRAVCTQLSCL